MKQVVLRKLAIATSTIVFAALLTVGFSVGNAQADRIHVSPYHYNPYNHYIPDQSGLSWYAVRAYYTGGPWCGVGGGYGYGTAGGWGGSWTCYSGWDDYKGRNGIGCDPGTVFKGGDGIMYVCQ